MHHAAMRRPTMGRLDCGPYRLPDRDGRPALDRRSSSVARTCPESFFARYCPSLLPQFRIPPESLRIFPSLPLASVFSKRVARHAAAPFRERRLRGNPTRTGATGSALRTDPRIRDAGIRRTLPLGHLRVNFRPHGSNCPVEGLC